MRSKRSEKVKRREERKKKNGNTVSRNKVATPHNPEGLKIQNQFDKAMVDEKLQEFQVLLSTCKNMITELYNRTVKIEVTITKLISLITKKCVFSKNGISNLEAISLLNIEKNKIFVFKKNVIAPLVADYVKASRCQDQLEAMHMLSDLGTNYTDALNTMQNLFEETRDLNDKLDLEETSEGSDDGIIEAPTVTEVEEIDTVLNIPEVEETVVAEEPSVEIVESGEPVYNTTSV